MPRLTFLNLAVLALSIVLLVIPLAPPVQAARKHRQPLAADHSFHGVAMRGAAQNDMTDTEEDEPWWCELYKKCYPSEEKKATWVTSAVTFLFMTFVVSQIIKGLPNISNFLRPTTKAKTMNFKKVFQDSHQVELDRYTAAPSIGGFSTTAWILTSLIMVAIVSVVAVCFFVIYVKKSQKDKMEQQRKLRKLKKRSFEWNDTGRNMVNPMPSTMEPTAKQSGN